MTPRKLPRKLKSRSPSYEDVEENAGQKREKQIKIEENYDATLSPQRKLVCCDLLSTLSGPPGVPDSTELTPEIAQGYAMAIPPVKNALVSFFKTSSPQDVQLLITQANSAFLTLNALHADYRAFYNSVNSYIERCVKLCAADKELERNKHAIKLITCHEKLIQQSQKAKKLVSDTKDQVIKEKQYLAPTEARVQDTKELLEKLQLELPEKRSNLASLEAKELQQTNLVAEIDAKIQVTEVEVKEARSALRDVLEHQEAARVAVEESRAQLTAT